MLKKQLNKYQSEAYDNYEFDNNFKLESIIKLGVEVDDIFPFLLNIGDQNVLNAMLESKHVEIPEPSTINWDEVARMEKKED